MINDMINKAFEFLRNSVTEADEAITTFDYDSLPSDHWNRPALDVKSVSLCFFGEGTENGTVAGKIYARGKNGPILRVCDVSLTFGTKAVTKHPISKTTESTAKWFDTITVSNATRNVTGSLTSGNNEIAEMLFSTDGIEDIYFEATSLTDITEVSAIIRGSNA